jgi:hypothetical protein
VLGFADEVGFSRLTQPALHAWTAGERLRLSLQATDRTDTDPKALACYGLWLPTREQRLLRFVDGRPVSPVTCAFLAWAAEHLAAEGVRVLALIGDNASWHISHEVRGWVRRHNRRVKRTGRGCRLLALPPAEPEPVAEPDRAPLGTRQARGGRAGTQAHRHRAQAAPVRALSGSTPPAARTTGRVIMH